MKYEEFIKYKKIVESDGLISSDEAVRVRSWMEKTGRIDEGFWGAIWSWLKKNFSVTARRIYVLADDYERELTSEMRAEWTKSKDLAAKVRAGSYAKLSRDIEERMELIAGDDQDYRDLVRTVINKRNLKVRKQMLSEFAGKIDDEDLISSETKKIDNEFSLAEKKEKEIVERKAKEKKEEWKPMSNSLHQYIRNNKKEFKDVGIDEKAKEEEFVKKLLYYANNLAEKGDIKFDEKHLKRLAIGYLDLVKEIHKYLRDVKKEEAIEIVKKVLNRFIVKDKPLTLDKLRNEVLRDSRKEIEKNSNEETDGGLPSDIVTDNTEEVVPVEVEKMVDTAKDETPGTNPSDKDVTEEVREEASKFLKESKKTIFADLKVRVKEFNQSSEEEKKKMKRNFDYQLDSKNNVAIPKEEDIDPLLEDYVKIVGKIVPFYLNVTKRVKSACVAVSYSLFIIYAIKKDVNRRITDKDIDKIVEAIKEQL